MFDVDKQVILKWIIVGVIMFVSTITLDFLGGMINVP